jgi:hypothetical protein
MRKTTKAYRILVDKQKEFDLLGDKGIDMGKKW